MEFDCQINSNGIDSDNNETKGLNKKKEKTQLFLEIETIRTKEKSKWRFSQQKKQQLTIFGEKNAMEILSNTCLHYDYFSRMKIE